MKLRIFLSLCVVSTSTIWGDIDNLNSTVETTAEAPPTQVDPATVYNQIPDIRHPTLQDYQLVQKYLTIEDGGMMRSLGDPYVDNNFKPYHMLGNGPTYYESGVLAINSDSRDRENCLILYCNFNNNFAFGLKRLLQHILESDFKGHVLFRIGGWPNVEEGDLVVCHVPYAFKVCAFREAKRLGYKRALWLDTPAIPKKSLNDFFQTIQEDGYFSVANSHSVGPYFNAKSAAYFGITLEESFHIPAVQAGVFGVDFTNEKTSKIIDLWYQAALDKEAFFSQRSDQNAISIILHQLGFTKRQIEQDQSHPEQNNLLESFDWLR